LVILSLFCAWLFSTQQEIREDWQQSASDILVHIGSRYPSQVKDLLLLLVTFFYQCICIARGVHSQGCGYLIAFPFDQSSQVLDELLTRFVAGVLPHYYVIKTLGDFTNAHALLVAPRLGELMNKVVPVLGNVRQENFRHVFAYALGKFCEALLHYQAESKLDRSLEPLRPDMLQGEMNACFDVLFTQWTQSREAKARLATVEALGYMCKVSVGSSTN
jgi:hypothetical protein